jgi:hypothetical protein
MGASEIKTTKYNQKSGRMQTDSTSELSSPKTIGSHRGISGYLISDERRSVDFAFKMIDEEHLS